MAGPDGQLTRTELAQLAALIAAQAAARDQLTRATVAAAQARLRGFRGWWRPADVALLIAQLLRLVQPAQRRLARQTDAYLARSTSLVLGRRVGPVGAVDITALRRALGPTTLAVLADADPHTGPGAAPPLPGRDAERAAGASARAQTTGLDPGVPYERLAGQYRYQVVSGTPEPEAFEKVVQRAAAVVRTDMGLAHRAQAHRFLTRRQVTTGYRRVWRPEEGSGGPPCGLCVVAADRIYSYQQLNPLHPGCRCEVVAVGDVADPGFAINAQDLNRLYGAAGSNRAEDLRQIHVQITEHGELGPVLIDADQNFRGPRDVARALADRPAG
jgi:hypothetical protein